MAGIVATLAVVGGAVTVARQQPVPELNPAAVSSTQPTPQDTPKIDSRQDALELTPSAPALAVPVTPSAPAVDPMQTVDAFVQRTRKEANDSIQQLTKEAEELRARLTKVEAALARWQEVGRALESPAPKVAPAAPARAAHNDTLKAKEGPALPTEVEIPKRDIPPPADPEPVTQPGALLPAKPSPSVGVAPK
jgi:hypothetical protein